MDDGNITWIYRFYNIFFPNFIFFLAWRYCFLFIIIAVLPNNRSTIHLDAIPMLM